MVQFLQNHNHSWKDIKTYTLNEIGVFIRECSKMDKKLKDERILTVWTGTNADFKYIKEHILDTKPLTHKQIQSNWKKLKSLK